MFVLLRSAVCIGLVVAALPDRPGSSPAVDGPALAAAAAGPALSALGRYCASNPTRCRLAVETTLEAARDPGPVPSRKLRPRPEAGPDHT